MYVFLMITIFVGALLAILGLLLLSITTADADEQTARSSTISSYGPLVLSFEICRAVNPP